MTEEWYKFETWFNLRIRTGEEISGYLLGAASRAISRGYSGDVNANVSWLFQKNLDEISKFFSPDLPHAHELIKNHTRLNAFKPFVSEGEIRDLYDWQLYGGLRPKILKSLRTKGGRRRLKFCKECVVEDKKNFGYSIWRRAHLLSGIAACSYHLTYLVTICDFCESTYKKNIPIWTPGLRCICGGDLKIIPAARGLNIEFAIDVATMANELLEGKGPVGLTREGISTETRKYLGGQSLVRSCADIRKVLIDKVGLDAMAMIGISDGVIDRFVRTESCAEPIRDPVQNLVLMHSIWGGWPEFSGTSHLGGKLAPVVRVERAVVRGDDSAEGKRRKEYAAWYESLPSEDKNGLVNQYRNWLKEIINKNPSVKRKNLLSYPGYWPAIRHLMSVDKAWFDKKLPVSRTNLGLLIVNGRRSYHMATAEHIKEFVDNIYSRHAFAQATRPMRRISIRYLTSALPSKFMGALTIRHPDVRKAVDACKDTEESWRARVTRNIALLVRQYNPEHRWASESWWNTRTQTTYEFNRWSALKWLKEKDASR
ncbi:TniQ family protein [Paraburkholderia bannensis]|uniref:TniQ family protein n=1 Tax=Paraburkholderia bannensis TaxID=765414 RepID=UPI002AB7BFAA|nr:TniQ family protein [Paraburkholderia bannensis]